VPSTFVHAHVRRFAGLRLPIRLLLGSASIPRFRRTTEALHAMLSDSRIVELPGQGHNAIVTSPDVFTDAAPRFLLNGDMQGQVQHSGENG